MGCRQYGAADTSKFGVAMPWVGWYVALASLALFVLISMDIVGSLRMWKRWISPKWLTLNSATLSILGVAAKMPADINTPMPGLWDQLTKLSGLVLVCVVITHAMPSTFDMESTSTVLSNMLALGILVVTLFVDMWIQMQTGVVDGFVGWCQVYSLLMLFLYFLAVSNCLVNIPMRGYVESSSLKDLKEEVAGELADKHVCDHFSMRACIATCWKRALECSPGNPLHADSTVLVSTIFTAVATITFMVTVATHTFHASWQCYTTSDYGWSNGVILFFQFAAILAGAVSCLSRSMAYLNADPKLMMDMMLYFVYTTIFGYKNLSEWITYLSPYPLQRILTAKNAREIRKITSVLCAILVSAAMWPAVSILFLFLLVAKQSVKLITGKSFVSTRQWDEYIDDAKHHVEKWYAIGKNTRPQALLDFLQQNSTTSRHGFPLVQLVRYCHNIDDLCCPRGQSSFSLKDTPGCWSLTIASLATMVCATTPHDQLPDSMKAVEQAFPFALFVDRNFIAESKGSSLPILAACVTWDTLKIDDTWQHCNMRTEAATFPNPVKMIEHLLERARQVLVENLNMDEEVDTAPEDSLDKLICKCMDAISLNILRDGLDHAPISDSTATTTDYNLRLDYHPRMILADVIGACILNLPRALLETCYREKPSTMDRKARDAALMLGQLEDILLWLQSKPDLQHYKANGSFEYLNFWGKQGACNENTTSTS